MSNEEDINNHEEEAEVTAPKNKRGRPSKVELARKRAAAVAERTAHRTPEHIAPPAAQARGATHFSEHDKPRIRTRSRHRSSDVDNPFYVPVDEIPEGLTYEWKRHAVVGQENAFYLAQMRRQGWEPVDPRNHPNWVPPGYDRPDIIKEGLILMERPVELTREAQEENREKSHQMVAEAEGRLGMAPKDTLSRQHPKLNNRVVKEWGRSIPVEE